MKNTKAVQPQRDLFEDQLSKKLMPTYLSVVDVFTSEGKGITNIIAQTGVGDTLAFWKHRVNFYGMSADKTLARIKKSGKINTWYWLPVSVNAGAIYVLLMKMEKRYEI